MSKFIIVTGGVVSSLGKGITAASLGRLLINRGLKVMVQKLDPYINVDPGTMSPYQHGEVFVTEDGAETDLDIGHYERFLDIDCHKNCNFTSGKIYSSIIAKERAGEYLGKTIQVTILMLSSLKSAELSATWKVWRFWKRFDNFEWNLAAKTYSSCMLHSCHILRLRERSRPSLRKTV